MTKKMRIHLIGNFQLLFTYNIPKFFSIVITEVTTFLIILFIVGYFDKPQEKGRISHQRSQFLMQLMINTEKICHILPQRNALPYKIQLKIQIKVIILVYFALLRIILTFYQILNRKTSLFRRKISNKITIKKQVTKRVVM